jgi:hypothetical protein
MIQRINKSVKSRLISMPLAIASASSFRACEQDRDAGDALYDIAIDLVLDCRDANTDPDAGHWDSSRCAAAFTGGP